jgi:hypothetical protein
MNHSDKTDAAIAAPTRAATQLLLHPIALTALALLLINDWVLKPNATVRRFGNGLGGVVTGKLSDAAGLVLAPLVLLTVVQLVTRRSAQRWVWPAIAVVAIPFVTCKLSPEVSRIAGALFSQLGRHAVVVADPTDLLALPVVLLVSVACRESRQR